MIVVPDNFIGYRAIEKPFSSWAYEIIINANYKKLFEKYLSSLNFTNTHGASELHYVLEIIDNFTGFHFWDNNKELCLLSEGVPQFSFFTFNQISPKLLFAKSRVQINKEAVFSFSIKNFLHEGEFLFFILKCIKETNNKKILFICPNQKITWDIYDIISAHVERDRIFINCGYPFGRTPLFSFYTSVLPSLIFKKDKINEETLKKIFFFIHQGNFMREVEDNLSLMKDILGELIPLFNWDLDLPVSKYLQQIISTLKVFYDKIEKFLNLHNPINNYFLLHLKRLEKKFNHPLFLDLLELTEKKLKDIVQIPIQKKTPLIFIRYYVLNFNFSFNPLLRPVEPWIFIYNLECFNKFEEYSGADIVYLIDYANGFSIEEPERYFQLNGDKYKNIKKGHEIFLQFILEELLGKGKTIEGLVVPN